MPEQTLSGINGPYFLAASTGGHLAQLSRMALRFAMSPREWLTFDHVQSRSLLEFEKVTYVPFIKSRDALGLIRSLPRTVRAVFRSEAETFISTGAAIALIVIPLARLRGKRAIYIESVSRFDGPSLTGRILRIVTPKAEFFTQHERWSDENWRYEFSLLEDYSVEKIATGTPRNFFVTLGTIRGYEFQSLLTAVRALLPQDAHIKWQVGETHPPSDLDGEISQFLDGTEMEEAALRADVVISHAGVGSALWLLDLGICPVLVPRRASRGEHVDDHQEQIARELAARGLAVSAESETLTLAHCELAASQRIQSTPRGSDTHA